LTTWFGEEVMENAIFHDQVIGEEVTKEVLGTWMGGGEVNRCLGIEVVG
jgi:hypothetical protein